MEHQKKDVSPVLLTADNLTPPQRTPWGGTTIRRLKEAWVGEGPPVGESWELSVEPSFPSRCEPRGEPLSERLAEAPQAWLGAEHALGGTALLVKLLDAAEALSVQIHPSDEHPGLAPGEAGKPESWYVVASAPGSGLYLGLAEGVDAAGIARALDEEADLSALLHFVEVEPGDFFVIEAGTPHCIGPGVTLVEPQRVAPGRRGVTYRYWDWGRRYDAGGRLDPKGAPRTLHREEALSVTRWDLPKGDALLARVRVQAGRPERDGAPQLLELAGPSPSSRIVWNSLHVARMSGTGSLALPRWGSLRGLSVLEGSVRLGDLEVPAGRTAAIPASWDGPTVLDQAHAILSAA